MEKPYYLFILAMPVLLLTGCDGSIGTSDSNGSSLETIENLPFVDVKNQNADLTKSFDSTLPESTSLYPLSTGATYYFSSSAADGGDGTISSPFNSLNSINSINYTAGTSVLFKCGETFHGYISLSNISGDDDNPITFASYGEGAKPIIDGPHNVLKAEDYHSTMQFTKVSNIVVRDLEVHVYAPDRLDSSGVSAKGIQFYYNYVKTNRYKNIYAVNNEVVGVDTSSNTWGIGINSLEGTPADAPHGIVSNVNFLYNVAHGFGRSGISSGGWLVGSDKNGNNAFMDTYNNVHFDHNIVYDTGTIGIYILGATDSSMNANVIHDTGLYEVNQIMEGECGIMAIGCKNCEIIGNEVYNVYDQKTGYDAMGIDIDWNTTNVNVQYNYCHDCMGSGIGTMANQNSFIQDNRIENCHGATNHNGAISISNFTSRYECVDASMHAVKNLDIARNLVLQNDNKSLFKVWNSNGDTDFTDDVFEENHMVYKGEDGNYPYFIEIDADTPWYKFSANKYYSSNEKLFKVVDTTPATEINIEEGAAPYEFSRTDNFGAWQKRDMGSTFAGLSKDLPAMPLSADVKYEDGKLKLNWVSNEAGSTWRYNIYNILANESVSYPNILGVSYSNEFEFVPKTKGTSRYVVQPESDQGIYGKAYIIEVTL